MLLTILYYSWTSEGFKATENLKELIISDI
jgi:hypothetical protein